MISKEDRIYAAGFFDADGTVGIYFKKHKTYAHDGYYYLQARIAQREPVPTIVAWFQARWGGSIYLDKRNHVYTWMASNKKAEKFLLDVEPFVKIKHDEVELALRFQRRKHYQGRAKLSDEEFAYRAEMSDTLKKLKSIRKGNSLPAV